MISVHFAENGSVPTEQMDKPVCQPEWPNFNVNHNVRVKLTDVGRAAHKAHWEPYSAGRYHAAEVDAEGWSTFQLWELMSVFGPTMSLGATVPFETTIRLDPDSILQGGGEP